MSRERGYREGEPLPQKIRDRIKQRTREEVARREGEKPQAWEDLPSEGWQPPLDKEK